MGRRTAVAGASGLRRWEQASWWPWLGRLGGWARSAAGQARRLGRWLVGVLLVPAITLAGVWFLQGQLTYFPGTEGVPSVGAVLDGGRDVVLRTDDGLDLQAWYVPGHAPRREVAVLVAHGNGGDRAGRAPLAAALAAEGLDVLLLDYRGYGRNPGRPSERGLALDARAARGYLLGEAGFTADRIIYFGESLGCGVVAELARSHPPAGLVLRSPFESLAAVARVHYPFAPAFMVRERFAVAEHVREVEAPVVVVYGSEDSIVPASQSRAVARAAPNLVEEVEVPGADHNDRVLLDGDAVVGAVVRLAGTVEGVGK